MAAESGTFPCPHPCLAQNSRQGKEGEGAGSGRFPSREWEFWQPHGIGNFWGSELFPFPFHPKNSKTPQSEPGKEAWEPRTEVTPQWEFCREPEFQFGCPKSHFPAPTSGWDRGMEQHGDSQGDTQGHREGLSASPPHKPGAFGISCGLEVARGGTAMSPPCPRSYFREARIFQQFFQPFFPARPKANRRI